MFNNKGNNIICRASKRIQKNQRIRNQNKEKENRVFGKILMMRYTINMRIYIKTLLCPDSEDIDYLYSMIRSIY